MTGCEPHQTRTLRIQFFIRSRHILRELGLMDSVSCRVVNRYHIRVSSPLYPIFIHEERSSRSEQGIYIVQSVVMWVLVSYHACSASTCLSRCPTFWPLHLAGRAIQFTFTSHDCCILLIFNESTTSYKRCWVTLNQIWPFVAPEACLAEQRKKRQMTAVFIGI